MYLSEYEADWDAVINPFYQAYETNLAGWVMNMSFTQKFDYNRCVLPERSFLRGLTWEQISQMWKDVNKDWDKI